MFGKLSDDVIELTDAPVFEPLDWLLRMVLRWQKPLYEFQRIIQRLPVKGQHDAGLQVVPIHRIIGSVGRSQDFDRQFRVRREDLLSRWKIINRYVRTGGALPPVDLIQIGSLYFVLDGHHRISVLRHLGVRYIDAHVTEVQTPLDIRTTAELRQIL